MWLDAGSDYDSRTNTLGNQAGTFEFSQVQIEKGSSATDFEHKSIEEIQTACFRYFQKGDTREGGSGGRHYASGTSAIYAGGALAFKTEMRTNPTVTLATHSVFGTATSFGIHVKNSKGMSFKVGATGNGTYYTNGGNYEADAEL